MGLIWDRFSSFSHSQMSVMGAWFGIIAFGFQIYFDFSAYSDMAIGLGKMMGFTFLENFNYPYISKSITEFWNRWHISLSSWFKEYVYIPLGGNRKGFKRQIFNICVVWFLTGFWHGAGWNFIFWGLYFAIILIIEKLFLYEKLQNINPAIAHLYTLVLVLISWVVFAFDDLSIGLEYIYMMLGLAGVDFINSTFVYYFLSNFVIVAIASISATPLGKNLYEKYLMDKSKFIDMVCVAVLCLILIVNIAYLVSSTYNPFLYFRF